MTAHTKIHVLFVLRRYLHDCRHSLKAGSIPTWSIDALKEEIERTQIAIQEIEDNV